MYYRVTAQLKTEAADELYRKLKDGTIRDQKPDGQEIVDSMNRAILTDSGQVEWSQVCYCSTPLAHERATVFDKHFDAITTEEIDGYQNSEGRPLMEHLAELASADGG